MTRSLGHHILLLLPLLAAAAAARVLHAAPASTTASAHEQQLGWTPKPTSPPLAAPHELFKRAFSDQLCGYAMGDTAQPLTCSTGRTCTTSSVSGVAMMGCCVADGNCQFRTACVDLSGCSESAACASLGPFTRLCSESSLPVCATYISEGLLFLTCAPAKFLRPFSRPQEMAFSSAGSSSSGTTPTPDPTPTATATPTPTPTPVPRPPQNLTAPIVGGVVGGLAVVILGVLLAVWVKRRNSDNVPPPPPPQQAFVYDDKLPPPMPPQQPQQPYWGNEGLASELPARMM